MTPRWPLVLAIAVITFFAELPAPAGADPGETKLREAKEHRQEGSKEFRIATVSTRNDMVSGDDVLVRIDVSPRVRLDRVVVELNGADVTGAFRADAASRSLLGLGRILNGGGGLASIPIFDTRGYDDDTPADIHMRIHGFSTRARLLRENGHFDNQVMWVAYPALGHLSTNSFMIRDALRLLDQWVESIRADTSDAPQAVKVVRARPADATDACFMLNNVKIVEPQTYDAPGLCNQLYPSYGTPRTVAGAPLAADIVKCLLKPIDWADYRVTFTPTERARLRAIFPEGVCDWTKRGVDQRPLKGTWLTFGAGEGGDDD
jgi:hypothetical protein